MKATIVSLVSIGILGALSSCTQFTTPPPAAPPATPMAQAGANPYGVPGVQTAQPGAYAPQGTAPYQPVQPINPPADQPYPVTPVTPATPVPPVGGENYTIQKGDTLWGLSRRYGVSVEAIRQANNIDGDTIMYGTTIQIPGR